MSKPTPEKTPVQLFDLLVELLFTPDMPQPAVALRLKPLIQAARLVPEQLGRIYYITQGPYFKFTSVFEKPSFTLYQVAARLKPEAYAQIKAYAQAMPSNPVYEATWENKWGGLWPKLTLQTGGTVKKAVTVRFMGLLPHEKHVVLTRG